MTSILGLRPPRQLGHCLVVDLDNGVSLDYQEHNDPGDELNIQHYAFLVSEEEFGEIYERVRARGQQHWAEPGRRRSGEINHNDGGSGVYFADPNGHMLEVITRP